MVVAGLAVLRPESETETGLGRPGGARCSATSAADEPPGHAGHAAALAQEAGPPAMDLFS